MRGFPLYIAKIHYYSIPAKYFPYKMELANREMCVHTVTNCIKSVPYSALRETE